MDSQIMFNASALIGNLSVQTSTDTSFGIDNPSTIQKISPQAGSIGYSLNETECQQMKSSVKDLVILRTKLGLTQKNVGEGLGAMDGKPYDQSIISRFEDCKLSENNMRKVKEKVEHFLNTVDNKTASPAVLGNQEPTQTVLRRKRRTDFRANTKAFLEWFYVQCKQPSPDEMERISEHLKHEYKVIRTWFSNRRQKDRKDRKDAEANSLKCNQPCMAPPVQNVPTTPVMVTSPKAVEYHMSPMPHVLQYNHYGVHT
ncbi:POU domain, class 5, transcription factor 3-like isoform X2 [Pelobates fuscus]|uniref:POU domain, class 5, transcription factor 3-like isoform X2 n=1 Tax=Pelobates fuscus TaxID=191477 RepID=UPI002FE4F77C